MARTILRRPQVEVRVGLTRSTIYEQMALGKFPKPVRLSSQRVGWLEHEIEEFLKARIAARDEVSA